jgi:hypothetical protein
MIFNLTEEIKLDRKWNMYYVTLRLAMYAIIIYTAVYFLYLLLFPMANVDYSFLEPAEKNASVDATNTRGEIPLDGLMKTDDSFNFFSYIPGRYSKTQLIINTDSTPISTLKVSIQKSYRANFYPLGDPLGFKEGSLVKNNNKYFIISQNELRRFPSLETVKNMGFKSEAFTNVSAEDLAYNKNGGYVQSDYPDSSLFKINGEYYQLRSGSMEKFVSSRAYLSQYSENMAVTKDDNFLEKYEKNDSLIGFEDGTIISFSGGAFIVSGTNAFPIQDPVVFESMGFKWDDVIPVDSEEIGIYLKQKTFDMKQPHPDGTIFADEKSDKYYYIQGGKKREIPSSTIVNSYNRRFFINVSAVENASQGECHYKSNSTSGNTYTCQASIASLITYPGNTYKISLEATPEIKINNINIVFKQAANLENLKIALINIKNKIAAKYNG